MHDRVSVHANINNFLIGTSAAKNTSFTKGFVNFGRTRINTTQKKRTKLLNRCESLIFFGYFQMESARKILKRDGKPTAVPEDDPAVVSILSRFGSIEFLINPSHDLSVYLVQR